ncbi:hypothetical protein JJJ17_07215 [Paracoccus caeni]|uniref:Uncharacterized protein n=1 Tax=Paracoccus caeni TaxID=657651 RepID=A0A934SE53_9RHOB|nr:hypothetical protein [Paracoccus caeni]MBK4215709.1 hypothetical protein [Paracoccus caeni]
MTENGSKPFLRTASALPTNKIVVAAPVQALITTAWTGVISGAQSGPAVDALAGL